MTGPADDLDARRGRRERRERRERNRATVAEVIRRLGEADFDGCAALLADGFVQEYPYRPTPDGPERIEGVEAAMAFMRPGMSAFEPYRYTIEATYDLVDPDTVIAEYTSHSRLLRDGTPYSNRYIAVFQLDADGRVERWREYLNPVVIADVIGRLRG